MSSHCPPKCGGCSCHISAPCVHCTEHLCPGCCSSVCNNEYCAAETKFQKLCKRIRRKYEYNKCEHCGREGSAHWESSRTQYHWDGKGEDPNRAVALCSSCAERHHEYWDEMWQDYYSGLL